MKVHHKMIYGEKGKIRKSGMGGRSEPPGTAIEIEHTSSNRRSVISAFDFKSEGRMFESCCCQ